MYNQHIPRYLCFFLSTWNISRKHICIYGIYKECITNRSIDIHDIKYKIIIHTQTQWGGRPIGAPPKAAPVCV